MTESGIIVTPPVLLIIFNRPDTTRLVFDRIREVKPERLFIAADGPRPGNPLDNDLCRKSRSVIGLIDWECDVSTLLHDSNLGCKMGPITAINWFFQHVKSGIILEDDCLPSRDFFILCHELLQRYHDDERIGMISGNNFGYDLYSSRLSYSFSRHGHIWGWATWKRCWDKYDGNLRFINNENISAIKANVSSNHFFTNQWWRGVDSVLYNNLDTWDYQWGVVRYANNYLTIRPRVNLVANLGFRSDATHTLSEPKAIFSKVDRLDFPLTHPDVVVPDFVADSMLEKFLAPSPDSMGYNKTVQFYLRRKLKLIRGFCTERFRSISW